MFGINSGMDYPAIYSRLIDRARTRSLSCYTENHHIKPKCLGGGDDPTNLVRLTPEEHYVAHQLLVKIHPDEGSLASAAYMMTVASSGHVRNNKLYGWLRRKHAQNISTIQSVRNSQQGTCWIHANGVAKKVRREELNHWLALGWSPGRRPNKTCEVCGADTGNQVRRFCKAHKPVSRQAPNVSDDIFLRILLDNGRNVLKTINQLGMSGMGTHYIRAKRLLATYDKNNAS